MTIEERLREVGLLLGECEITPLSRAMEAMYDAVGEMRAEQQAKRAAEVASCLANGIIPD